MIARRTRLPDVLWIAGIGLWVVLVLIAVVGVARARWALHREWALERTEAPEHSSRA